MTVGKLIKLLWEYDLENLYKLYGTQEEFDLIEQLSFNIKKEAEQWCKKNRYPLKCVMKESEYNNLKSN